ncbi:hypothetical protein B0H14DRAFT_3523439 [Mycena olivaceomarginata]|nr:hypothetical protein B0H14DRAFT_3523439 [Mycena olivaceomarginata]
MRMRRFISGLESVKNMSLSLAAWRQGLVFLSLKNEGELRAWASHVGGLLNCIVQRGCTSLTITDGSSIEPDRPSVLNWMVRWLIPKGSNDMPTPPPPFPAGPLHLTTLIIDSATLMAPITTLCLRAARCDASTWGAVLPRIAAAAPELPCLVLTQIDDGHAFLPPALRAAHGPAHLPPAPASGVPMATSATGRRLALAVPALRYLKKLRLKELHARAELAENFLSSEGALPELFMLCALWLAPPELNLDPLLTLLVPIAAKLRAYPPLAAADVVPNLPVDDGGQIAEGCARVERIELDLDLDVDDHRGKAADDVLGIARLLAVFPNVMSVSLSTRGTIPESSVTRLVQNIPPTARLTEIQLNGKMY